MARYSRLSVTASGLLTDREVEIARLVALGLSNTDASAAAGISCATVKSHVSNILMKLGCTSRLQIAVWAYEHGIVRVGEGVGGRIRGTVGNALGTDGSP